MRCGATYDNCGRAGQLPEGEGDSIMGETHVPVLIRNPAEPQRTWEGIFLVDTGAND